MKTFSANAQRIIDQHIENYTRPLCVILDHDFRVKAWSGDYAYYGFDGLEVGKDCRDSMLFLVGLSAQESIQLQFIETPSARAAHLQLMVDADEMVLVLLDATEQRANNESLQQKGYELALMHAEQLKLIDELKRLEKEVEAKRRQAEQANLLKGRFIATMSHEFRTPLASILGYTERLKQRDDFDSTALKYLGSVERGAQHLLSLVENLLDQSQIDVDSLIVNPTPTHIRVVFDKLFSIFEPLAEDKRLEFRFDIAPDLPECLVLDEMRFRQILVNLISNAIKFTEQGTIQLYTRWGEGELTVCIEDTGKGIAKADQERIFDAFEQLGNHPGTGLGLSIVKHLVNLMGGKLVLTSSLGKGSRFELSLPAKQAQPRDDACQTEFNQDKLREKSPLNTVLLVEDDPDIMELLQGIFDEAGYPTLAATTGNDAIAKALSSWPDLILLDLNLPDMTGFDVVKTLRNSHFHNPVFAQSAWQSSDYKAKAIAAGCNEYLQKPLDVTELKLLISGYFVNDSDPGMPLEKYQELCQRFVASLPEKQKNLQQLVNAISKQNWDEESRQELFSFSHRLAGSAGLYGMNLIANAAKTLSQLLVDYECIKPNHNMAELQGNITRAVASLTRYIEQRLY